MKNSEIEKSHTASEQLLTPSGVPELKATYANLDLLRSLAVLSVVFSHLWKQGVIFNLWSDNPRITLFWHDLSFTGVMFFLVHTCLVLMLSMDRTAEAHRGRSFLIRRAFRIFPLCWAVILLSLATGLTDEPGGTFLVLGWRGVAVNLLLVHNILRGYSSVIGPLWSLDWEVQMYLLLPLFYLALARFKRLSFVFSLWLGATLLAVTATQPEIPRLFHVAIFPPMFIGGMVAYKLLKGRSSALRNPALPACFWPFVVLGLFVLQGVLIGERSFESPTGAAIDAGVCLALALAIPAFRELRAVWIVRPAQRIAKYSYGVYLLHIPALIFVLRNLPGLSLALKIALFLALTALLAFLSFHLIEDPLIQIGKRLAWVAPALQPNPLTQSVASENLSAIGDESRVVTSSNVATLSPLHEMHDSASTTPPAGYRMNLSVLMSVYGKELASNLCQCLDSLAAQSLPADEVVIVEDGPLTPALKATIDAYRRLLPIVSLRLPENIGLGAALRVGLYACRGSYVARMDSDDISLPERFAKQVEFLNANPAVDVVGGAIAEFQQDCSAPDSIRLLPASGSAIRRLARSRTPMNHVTVVFRKASVVAAGNYESCRGFEDYHLWARMLALGYRLHNLQDVLVYVRCGKGMSRRRGGLAYLWTEVSFQSFLRKMGLLDMAGSLLNILTRGPVRLAPNALRAVLYRIFLRRSPRLQAGWMVRPAVRVPSGAPALSPGVKISVRDQQPLVSIITPVYNAARWLPETLATVRAQTLGSWEHILVDDGSTDGSLAIAEAAASEDARIRVMRSTGNEGPPMARNQALDAARGRFIAFLDADDLWHPEKLARSVEWMTAQGYGFIYHDYRHISHDGSRIGRLITGPEELNLESLHTRRGTGGCLTVVIDRERIPSFHFPGLRPPYRAEDFCLWLSLIQQGHNGHRLPFDLGRYRLSPESRSANKLGGALNAWRIYRKFSRLSLANAASWWVQYAWNDFWLYRYARPR